MSSDQSDNVDDMDKKLEELMNERDNDLTSINHSTSVQNNDHEWFGKKTRSENSIEDDIAERMERFQSMRNYDLNTIEHERDNASTMVASGIPNTNQPIMQQMIHSRTPFTSSHENPDYF